MTAYLYVLLTLLTAGAVFAAGLPLRGPRPDGWWKAAVARDAQLLKLLAWLLAAVLAAFALELLDGPGAWLLLAVVAPAAVPLAADRWRDAGRRARRTAKPRS